MLLLRESGEVTLTLCGIHGVIEAILLTGLSGYTFHYQHLYVLAQPALFSCCFNGNGCGLQDTVPVKTYQIIYQAI